MAALAGDLAMSTIGPTVTLGLVTNVADTYYRGSLVFADAAGGVQLVPVAGDRFVGFSPCRQVIATAGDRVQVVVEGYIRMPAPSGATTTDEGILIYVDVGGTLSDNIDDCVMQSDTDIASTDMVVGRVFEYTSATDCIFKITHGTAEAAAGETYL